MGVHDSDRTFQHNEVNGLRRVPWDGFALGECGGLEMSKELTALADLL